MALILKNNKDYKRRKDTVVHKSATYGIMMAAALICGAAVLSSCEKKVEVVSVPITKDQPSVTARNFETQYTDSGKVRMILRAKLLESYKDEKYTRNEFPEGLNVLLFNGGEVPRANIASKYAKYTERDKLWELRDSVVVIDNQGKVLQTELLYWNEAKELVYSDRYVKITDKDQITMGTGYEYNMRTGDYEIKNTSAKLYIEDEK